VRPTIVIAVPRFYEKTRMKILDAVANAPRWKQGLFKWATRVGMRVSQLRIRRRKIPFGLAFFHGIAGLTVFNKIRKAMGGRIRFFVSGGAPLSKRLARFFHVLSMMVLEGYGLTETSPVLAVNALEDFKFGTVGKPIAGIGVRIAEDGEIMTSGPCVMQGYFKNPGATAGVMRDGWFYTGDIGYFDRDGFLRITDRKKDIIVTAGGKNVAPLNIEGRILSDSLFSRVMVVGDKRPYLCALLVLNRENLMRAAGVCASSEPEYAALLKRTETYEFVRRRLDACLEGLASYERIKAFELIKDEFTIAGGELTPTLKIKRRAVIEKYRDIIDALYQRTDDRWAAASSKDAGTGCP